MRKNIHANAKFRYRFGYRRNGQDFWATDWRDNLILDSGLDKVASTGWVAAFAVCSLGVPVSPTPVRRDSSPITFTTSGTTCTASGSFFSVADVGRLIKFNDGPGTEVYITAFTDASNVTINSSPGIVAQTGTVWYVNETALDTWNRNITTFDTSAGNNQTTASGNTITHKRTFLGTAISGTLTFTEIGFNDGTGTTNIFDRDIIVGGVTLVNGDQPKAEAQLILTYDPSVSTAVGNVGTGFDTSGNSILAGILNSNPPYSGIQVVQSSGATQNDTNNSLEPNNATGLGVKTATFTLPAFSNTTDGAAITNFVSGGGSLQPYSNGNFFRDVVSSFSTGTANGTIFGFVLPTALITGSYYAPTFEQELTTSFAKTSAQTLSLTLRRSWQRTLTN